MDKPNVSAILNSLQLLRSHTATERRRGVQKLSPLLDDPRVRQVFEHLYANDPDSGVQELAWRALAAHPSIPAPGPEPLPQAARPASASAPSAALAVQPRAPAQHPRRPTAPAVPTLFLLKPSNAGIVTRQTRRLARRKRRSRLLVVLGGVLLLVAGVVWGLVLPDWWTWYRLEQDGATVTGTLSELSRSGEHYYAHYRFFTPQQDAASDVPHTGQQRVDAGSVDAIDASDAVSVTYLPDDPTVSRLARANPADTLRNQRTWLAGGLTGLVLVAFAASAIQRRPDKIVIRGQVVAASSTRDADGDHHLKLRCRFRAPTGRSFTFQASRIRNDITPDGVPKPGTPVAVYYRSDRSFTLL